MTCSLCCWLLRRGNGFYPGTGDIVDCGKGPGRGFNLNIPFPRGGFNDADYVAAFDLVRPPRLEPPSATFPCILHLNCTMVTFEPQPHANTTCSQSSDRRPAHMHN